ncbi:MAG: transposase [Treponema sp.]|nr:transposase [Treponema sp.]
MKFHLAFLFSYIFLIFFSARLKQNGKSNPYYPHRKRGKEAMDEMGILSDACGVLIHDHWKAYYSYEGKMHGLCNAHHLRELTAAKEGGQEWAQPGNWTRKDKRRSERDTAAS